MMMVESSDAGEVQGEIFIIIWSFGLRWSRMMMVESSDAGEVQGVFFVIIWSFGLR